jgi:(R,R)-butanediol dehydrogenase/meso-butanediol dehydrogenase/diacetyl reductase
MKAAVYYGAGDIRIEDVSDPSPGPGELLLEIHAAGICGTDVGEFVHGPMSYAVGRHSVTGRRGPLIPGHELSGRVVSRGPGAEEFELGTVVASGAGISCGECFQCHAGRTNLCLQYSTVGLHRNGALAQFCAVPAATCLDVSTYGLDEETAALAQPMAIAVHSMRRGRINPGEDAVVIGAGGIGAFLIYAAAEAGARVTVVDLAPDRLELACHLGAAETMTPTDGVPLGKALAELDVHPMVVYEVTGGKAPFYEAIEAVMPGGRLVFVGLQADTRELDARRLTLTEIEFIGTNAHVCSADLPEALRLLAARGTPWNDVAPIMLPLDELVPDGVRPMAEGRATRVKTLIDPWADAPRERTSVLTSGEERN